MTTKQYTSKNLWDKEEITMYIRKYFQLNENETRTF